jgi:hypothetical protein
MAGYPGYPGDRPRKKLCRNGVLLNSRLLMKVRGLFFSQGCQVQRDDGWLEVIIRRGMNDVEISMCLSKHAGFRSGRCGLLSFLMIRF